MKPIRSNELEFFKELIKDKFYDKQEQIQSEIQFEADKLSEKKKSTFAKECGVDKDIKQLTKVNDEYLNFIRTKRVVEEKLLDKVNQMANAISNRLERLSKARQWDTNFNSFNAKEDGVEYFTNKLDEVCYQEAKEHIKKDINFIML